MYRYFYTILILLAVQVASAQQHEIGIFAGGSNPISDIGRGYYVLPNRPAVGGVYKWNFHERMSVRVQLTGTQLYGNDRQSDIAGKRKRDFSFKTDVTEMMTGVEFHFREYRIEHLIDRPWTPYVFVGIGGFWHDDLYFDNTTAQPLEAENTTRREFDAMLPVALGIKKKITQRLILAGEVGFRYTLTNNVDGNAPTHQGFMFGNLGRSYDWYTMVGASLTYTFWEAPCYCKRR